jgi:hypothetical protein
MEKRKRTTGTVCAFILLICAVGVAEYRKIDGSYNNAAHPYWGKAGGLLMRNNGVAYDDGVWTPAGRYRASPRVVSNIVIDQDGSIPNTFGRSDYIWAWGQIIDHDIDLTEPVAPAEPFNIIVPPGDPMFDPEKTGGVTLPLNRSEYDPATGTGPGNPREQINKLTAWIDASMVYGSDASRAKWLRAGYKGRMKVTPSIYGDLLPYNDGTQPNGGGMGTNLFVSGDIRTNENAVLTCIHTILVREHNRLAGLIGAAYPSWSDEQIYQKARKIVGAEVQVITYKEFLPSLLGEYDLPPYTGYKPYVDPTVSNEFSAAAFRFGHTTLSPLILRLDEYGREVPYGHVPLGEAFMNPLLITEEGGLEPFLRGLAYQLSQQLDIYVVDDVRNILFGNQDLPSLNMQRSRDHGLYDYNTMRAAFGLTPFTSFSELTGDPRVQSALASAYGSINNIDPWVGMIGEDDGGRPGNLLRTVIRQQFVRLRDGDRFWYQNDPELKDLLPWLESVRLSDIIMYNTGIRNLQRYVFVAAQQPAADEMCLSAAYVFKGYGPGCDSVMVCGNSMDATHEDMLNCDTVKVSIYVDDEPNPVISQAMPVAAGGYSQGKFIYRSRDTFGVAYLQCDFVHKTFYVIARKLDMGGLKHKLAVELCVDGYNGRGETEDYVWK